MDNSQTDVVVTEADTEFISTFEQKKVHYAKSKLKIVQYFLSCNPQPIWEEDDSKRWFSEVSTLLVDSTALKRI